MAGSAVLVFGVLFGAAAPAVAAPATCDAAGFAAEFNGAPGGSTVTLCGDVTITASDTGLSVPAGAVLTLDLDGHKLTVTGGISHVGINVPHGAALTITDSVGAGTIENAGTIVGSGTLTGDGTVVNSGAISNSVDVDTTDGLTVTGHNYLMAFDSNGGGVHWPTPSTFSLVYGPTLSSVGLDTTDLPVASRPGYDFTGWFDNLAGTGSPIGDDTPISTATSSDSPVPVTLHAGWAKPIPLSISTTELPAATVGAGYSASLSSIGGTGTTTWSITDGTLPGGLHFDSTDGTISGSPEESGSFPITVQVTDAAGKTATTTLLIAVAPAIAPLTVDTTSLPAATVGQKYDATLRASGGTDTTYTWVLASGSLPPGLHLSDAGTIAGTPTSAGAFHFTVSVNDPVTADLVITVEPAASPAPPATTPDGDGSATAPDGDGSATTPDGGETATTAHQAAPALATTGFDIWNAVRGALAILLAGGVLLALGFGIRRRRS